MKPPYVKANAQYYLKDPPNGYLGLTTETYQIGLKPCPLGDVIMGLVLSLTRFYAMTMQGVSVDEINTEIQRAAEGLAALSFEEVEKGHGGQAKINHTERS